MLKRRRHGAYRYDDGADGKAPHDRALHEQEADHGEHEGAAAEEDGTARGRARRRDRIGRIATLRPLLPEARDDEERVVDAEGEAHPREHVHHEEGELPADADERREPEPDDDRDDGEQQRQGGGHDRAEDEQEDEQRRRHADELPLGQKIPPLR
jgi:hypothetical protein